MAMEWYITVLTIVRNATASLGILIVILGILGVFRRLNLSSPRCRRCNADLRPLAWVGASDAAAIHGRQLSCPSCRRRLTARSVRWRVHRVNWRMVGLGVALVAVSMGVLSWTISRTRQGLTWRDLVPGAWDLQAIEAKGYPDSSWSTFGAGGEWVTWQPSAWKSLNRRASAGQLSLAELDAAARVIERSTSDSNGPTPFVRAPFFPAPHADLLIEILQSQLDPSLRSSAAAILLSPPGLRLTAVGDDPTVHSGDRVSLTLITIGKGQTWGDHSQLLGHESLPDLAYRHRLDGLLFVQEVWLNGTSIPFTTRAPSDRSGSVMQHPHGEESEKEQFPTVNFTMDAAAGEHEVAVVIDTAVVDFWLAKALVASQGSPGPPQRWGDRRVVRRQTVRQKVVVADPNSSVAGAEP